MTFWPKVRTLMSKNLRILVRRHLIRIVFMAVVVPLALASVFSFAKNLFVPPAVYGFGQVHPVKTLAEAFDFASKSGRRKVVLIDNGFMGGDIERVLDKFATQVAVSAPRVKIVRAHDETVLSTECRSSLRGVTACFNAVVMMSSPNEGNGAWNYTIRTDSDMWSSPVKIRVDRSTNPEEIYLLPVQRAIDSIIASLKTPEAAGALARNQELAFTSITQEQREAKVKTIFHKAIANFMGVVFLTNIMWISYHMAGFIAMERESGMSQLVDAMMRVKKPWMALAARIISHHLSFSIIYAPAWVVGSLIVRFGVFTNTHVVTVLVLYITSGLGIASMSILIASFFKKAQLSGVVSILAIILLGILAQSLTDPPTWAVALLSLLFTPCAFVFFVILMARFGRIQASTNLVHMPPQGSWEIPGIVLLLFIILHIFVYPLLAAVAENMLYGVATKGRRLINTGDQMNEIGIFAVQLSHFKKIYYPGFFSILSSALRRKVKKPVVAVEDLSFDVAKGAIVALLGANGSGKSTTLDAIAGLNRLSGGMVAVEGTRGLGIAPQRNVLWDNLTVEEHLIIFNKLKSPKAPESHAEIVKLIRSIDLVQKKDARAKTLSGGQKRKLQLGMMLVGGSAVCCVDEVSSGIDPLSRRKIWDILLAERRKRTLIITTHFLDEADLLADHIVILSKGTLRAEGTSAELKARLGGGYRIQIHKTSETQQFPEVPEVVMKDDAFDQVTYVAPTANLASQVIKRLQSADIDDYRFSGPTIENVFLQVAEEAQGEEKPGKEAQDSAPVEEIVVTDKIVEPNFDTPPRERDASQGLGLLNGRRVSHFEQALLLFKKRWSILRSNYALYFIAFLLPIVAAGFTSFYVQGKTQIGCSPADQSSSSDAEDAVSQLGNNFDTASLVFPVGPPSRISRASLTRESLAILANPQLVGFVATMLGNLRVIESFGDFNHFVRDNAANITTGLWLGDETSDPTIAWVSNLAFTSPLTAQQFLNLLLTNTTIQTTWTPFELPFNPKLGKALNLVCYMALALAGYPAFFALYPSNERRRFVRSLQYSNGVLPLPLWIAYLLFDFLIVLLCSGIVTALWAGLSEIWIHIEYLFVVLMLYGLASILVAYFVSLFAATQLATFGWAVFLQGVVALVYLVIYIVIVTYVQAAKIDSAILICHFVISAIMPIGSVIRALFLATNLFSAACDGMKLSTRPMALTQFGGPILYLILQSCILFGLVLWFDSGSAGSLLSNWFTRQKMEDHGDEVSDQESRGDSTKARGSRDKSDDGLSVSHVTKSYGKNIAVDNVSFGVNRGEVFALLGPNGAGKSTMISLIRGDLRPSRGSGDILIENISVLKDLAAARVNLGVCPQIDALDQMTVREHLEFYARVRGIPDVQHNVQAVLRAVGLASFVDFMASALSGGNKRKLSLGIALMGNPAVILLDEPSSGLDAAAKRIMWKTLQATVPGRSILLTTHSMEEADALAGRAGILARRMLALGTPDDLRHQFGDILYVHLVSSSAPRTTDEEMELIISWIQFVLPTATIDSKTYYGQVRFSVPGVDVPTAGGIPLNDVGSHAGQSAGRGAIGRLFLLLEETKNFIGVEHYSVSPTTLDEVFLTIVGQHMVQEEGHENMEEGNPDPTNNKSKRRTGIRNLICGVAT